MRKAIATQMQQAAESDLIELLLADLRNRFKVVENKSSVLRLYETAQ